MKLIKKIRHVHYIKLRIAELECEILNTVLDSATGYWTKKVKDSLRVKARLVIKYNMKLI